jgi:hypothetical protein
MSSRKTKLILVGILCLVIFYFTQWTEQTKMKEVTVKSPALESSPKNSNSKSDADTAEVKEASLDEKPHSNLEVREPVVDKTQQPSENLTGEVRIDFDHLEKLYQARSHSKMQSKITDLKLFEGLLSSEEKYFYGAFQGLLPAGSKILRLNLEFNKSYDRMGRETCLVVGEQTGAGSNILMRAEKLRLYRSDDPGYLVLEADGETYLEIYLTRHSPRRLKAYLKIPGSKDKLPLVLHEKPKQYNGTRMTCEDFWPERK